MKKTKTATGQSRNNDSVKDFRLMSKQEKISELKKILSGYPGDHSQVEKIKKQIERESSKKI